MKILGADISLRHGAFVSIEPALSEGLLQPIGWSNITAATYNFKTPKNKMDVLREINADLSFISTLDDHNFVFIEGGSFGSKGNIYHLGVAAGVVLSNIMTANVTAPIEEIPPQTWRSITLLTKPPKGIKGKSRLYLDFIRDNVIESYVDVDVIDVIISHYGYDTSADIVDALLIGIAGWIRQG